MELSRIKCLIEAVLFAKQSVSIDDFKDQLKTETPQQISTALMELKKDYQERSTSIEIIEKEGIWRMNVKPEFTPFIKEFLPCEFPKSIMETLAVIAWKSPVEQSKVIRIRGNKAYDHIKMLMEEGLVNQTPKGKTYSLSVTKKFYDHFDLGEKYRK